MNKIIFTPIFDIDEEFYPIPSSKNLPTWYKKTNSFFNSKKFEIVDGVQNTTIKKCMPVFDSMTAGYIIKTWVDVYVKKTEDGFPHYSWPGYDALSFHAISQAPNHPSNNSFPFPKWNSPWSIKTSRGYSCLFIPPMHNPNGIFTIMPGMVDTDLYINPVNFPFTLDDPNFQGMIPAGTPICQVIPFKRDSFKMNISEKEKDIRTVQKFSNIFVSRWKDNYKNKFWNKKEFK